MRSNLVKISSQKTFENWQVENFTFIIQLFEMVWATIHKLYQKSSAGHYWLLANVRVCWHGSNYFHFSFFPWRRSLHATTQIRYCSDHMWVGAALLVTAGPTLHRWHVWSLERIEIFVVTPNLPPLPGRGPWNQNFGQNTLLTPTWRVSDDNWKFWARSWWSRACLLQKHT